MHALPSPKLDNPGLEHRATRFEFKHSIQCTMRCICQLEFGDGDLSSVFQLQKANSEGCNTMTSARYVAAESPS